MPHILSKFHKLAKTNLKGTYQEVNTARTRLDATLQSLVEKKDEPEEESAESDNDIPFSIDFLTSDSPVSSPSKKNLVFSSKGRKRKRREDVVETEPGGVHHHSYVMKLFDRSVDLAQFNEDSSLYSISRAWISNKTQQEERTPSPEPPAYTQPDEAGDANQRDIYTLPPPIKLKIEYGVPNKDPRIPPLIPNKEKPLDIYADPDEGPPPEELLLRHMDRWKRIRNTWCNAARINELKYSSSMNILKTMYERQLQGDPTYE